MLLINSCDGNEMLRWLLFKDIIVFKWHCPIHSFVCPSLVTTIAFAFSEAHIRSYSKLEMKQTHIHNGINLSSIRAIRLNYPISLHKTSTLNNACYHSNYCTLWTTLNTTCNVMHCMLDTLEDIFMHLQCFKIGNYCITFILHCLPKSEYLTVIASIIIMSCLHFLLGYSTGEFHVLQLIDLAVFGAVD